MSKSEVLASERGNQMVTPTEDYYPDHDGGKFAPILATTVATWRARAFLENLALDAEGAIFVTVYSHNLFSQSHRSLRSGDAHDDHIRGGSGTADGPCV